MGKHGWASGQAGRGAYDSTHPGSSANRKVDSASDAGLCTSPMTVQPSSPASNVVSINKKGLHIEQVDVITGQSSALLKAIPAQ